MGEIGTLATLASVLALSVVSPGPNFVLVTSTAMRASRRAGLAVAAGLVLATLSWVVLTEAGFALLLAPGTLAAGVVRVVGAAYLVFIGIRMVAGARRPLPDGRIVETRGVSASLRKGYLVSMTNPKSIAFYASILGPLSRRKRRCGSTRASSRSPSRCRRCGTAPWRWPFPRTA